MAAAPSWILLFLLSFTRERTDPPPSPPPPSGNGGGDISHHRPPFNCLAASFARVASLFLITEYRGDESACASIVDFRVLHTDASCLLLFLWALFPLAFFVLVVVVSLVVSLLLYLPLFCFPCAPHISFVACDLHSSLPGFPRFACGVVVCFCTLPGGAFVRGLSVIPFFLHCFLPALLMFPGSVSFSSSLFVSVSLPFPFFFPRSFHIPTGL